MKVKIGKLKRTELKCLLTLYFVLCTLYLSSQEKTDSLKVTEISKLDSLSSDTLPKKPKAHSAARASMFSAIIPGLGQAYNKKYWKMPIIYAGLGATGYFIVTNRALYLGHKSAYIAAVNKEPVGEEYEGIPVEGLNQLMQTYQKNMEWSMVGAFAIYLVNIIDASVDGHLYDFDVSDDLSLRLIPDIGQYGLTQSPNFQLKMQITF